MRISCAFATSSDTPRHAQLAEELGYERAWLYDSPAVYPDVWMILSRCAERTSRLGLGPGVLVPSLRHPMVNAAAIAELVQQAPGRVAVAIGAGFSGRLALDEGETLDSPRAVDALGPGSVVLYHAMYERGGAAAVDGLPGGTAWREAIEAVAEPERHLAIHEGHLVQANERDRPHVAELLPFARSMALTGAASEVPEKIAELETLGVTELAYQPAGADIERELRAFAEAAIG